MQSWLKQPLVDLDAIGARHDAVEALVGDAELRGQLRDTHMRGGWGRGRGRGLARSFGCTCGYPTQHHRASSGGGVAVGYG